ncbi:hypothetical protein GCM10023094_52020 [Rhodococcus olei]|uniref:Uncharacterized protein n=1 Tax=Rhodococcus olei TaxID=2161675 RepID=A0ABP8PNQ2_9NOCA
MAVDGGVQAADREDLGAAATGLAVLGWGDAALHVDRGERRREGAQPALGLVEVRVPALGGEPVVLADRGLQRTRRHADVVFELLERLGDEMRLHAPAFVLRDLLVRLLVEDHPHLQSVLVQGRLPDQSGVDVLVDEALPDAVDDHPAHHHPGDQRDADLAGGHVLDRGTDRLRHHDAAAVVAAVGVDAEAHQLRGVLGDHLGVVGEAAGRQDHAAAGAVRDGLVEVPGDDTDDPTRLHDQPQRRRVGVHRDRGLRDRLAQHRHQHLAAEPVGGDAVPARRRRREIAEGVGVLTHPHQAVVGRRDPGRGVPQGRLERHAVVDQPLVVRDALPGVEAHLLPVGVRAEGGEQELLHVLGGVGEPARLLDRGAAAEVHLATGQRRRAAAPALPLEHDHLGAGRGGLQRGGRAGAAVADDQDVGLVVVRVHVGGIDGGDGCVCAHSELLSGGVEPTVTPVTLGGCRVAGKGVARWAGRRRPVFGSGWAAGVLGSGRDVWPGCGVAGVLAA